MQALPAIAKVEAETEPPNNKGNNEVVICIYIILGWE